MTENYPWRTGRYCHFRHHYHLVFVTKYRRGVFSHGMLAALRDVFSETCTQMECELLEFNGETDHVHLLVTCPPKRAIATLVGKLKGKSSHFLRKNYWDEIRQKLWGEHFWSPSYCSVTCGGAPLAIVKQYIDEQRRPPTEKGIIASKRENRVNRPGGEMPAGRASNRKQKS